MRTMPFLLVQLGHQPPAAGDGAHDARARARRRACESMKARTRGKPGEIGVDEFLRRLLRHADVLRQRERRLSVEQRVVDDLRAAPQLVRVESAAVAPPNTRSAVRS